MIAKLPLKYRRLLLAGLAIILFLILQSVLNGFIRDQIIVPSLYFFWVAYIFLSFLPQGLWWAVFLVIIIVLALRSVPSSNIPSGGIRVRNETSYGRISHWYHSLGGATRTNYSEWRFARELGQLSFKLLAQQERQSAQDIRLKLSKDALNLPPKTRAYLRIGLSNFNPFEQQNQSPFYRLTRHFRKKDATQTLDDVENVVQFLEDIMHHKINTADILDKPNEQT